MSVISFQADVQHAGMVGKAVDEHFYQDVVSGLSRLQKQLSPKYFYDDEGSCLFDAICELNEYYPYRAELEVLDRVAADLSSRFCDSCLLVEFGAGSLKKVEPLLNELRGIQQFIPIDISGSHLRSACAALQDRYSWISVCPLVGDFCQPVDIDNEHNQCLGFFPGSTIGNFSPDEARAFLQNARQSLGEDSYMVIGVDTKKNPSIIHRAYNDQEGVTARFNLNVLARINRELAGDFNLERFGHYACYNPLRGRVEMHLVSLSDQCVRVADKTFLFRKGESIHTENSYKYTPAEFSQLAITAGWQVEQCWLADEDLFAVYLLGPARRL